MAKIQTTQLNVEMQVKAIELLESTLHFPPQSPATITNFNFNIQIDTRIEATQKLVFIIVHVNIKNDSQTQDLGSLSVSCIFEIINFEQAIPFVDGLYNLPRPLVETLNSISISTTRGVMFSTFKGTFLHGAVLPIVDPKQFKIEG